MVFGRCRKRVEDEPETDDECPDKVPAEDQSTSSGESTQVNIDDELEMMLEVILKLREDPEFAKSMYGNCPRLQHLLNKHPDLRPMFEDPRLICINFEKVYTDAGGILPEDMEKYRKSWFQRTKMAILRKVKAITETRAFKVFKCLLLIKKLMGFLNPMKLIGCAKGCCQSMCCFVEDVENMLEDADADGDADDPHRETREAVNKAADYMEDPDVQEQMNHIMENPETMEDAIEQNEHLRDLRDSNPVCAELMSDPDSMRIITNPDNLRALGDAPELLEADFTDSGFEPPETQVDFGGETDMGGIDELDGGDVEAEQPAEPRLAEIEEVDESAAEAAEGEPVEGEPGLEEEEGMEGPTADDFEDVEYEDKQGGSKARGKKGQQQKKGQKGQQRGGFGGVTESAFAFLGGQMLGELAGGVDLSLMGDGDELEGLDAEAPEVDEVETADAPEVDSPDSAEVDMEDAALVAMVGASVAVAGTEADALDEWADTAKDQVDNMEDVADEADDNNNNRGRAAAAGAGAGGAGVAVAADGKRSGQQEEDEEEEEEDDKPKGFRGFLSSAAAGLKDATKETLMASVIGEDATEFVVDDLAQDEEDEEEEDDKEKKEEKEEGAKKKSRRRLTNKETGTSGATGDDSFADALDR